VSVVTVETTTRSETTSLLRKLRGHKAYAIQIAHAHWLVRSVAGSADEALAEIEALIAQWADEEGTTPTVVVAGDAFVPFPGRPGVPQ
jgi:predicted Ser/Thr protein kinase